jgi:tripartite-type tricarboxylate transporter receptor subunit TctC
MNKPATLAALLLTVASGAIAQSWPSKPLRVIVPSQAGGAADVVARRLGAGFTAAWQQQVVVDNRIGVVGTEIAAGAPADGYTILFSPDSMIVREAVYPDLPYRTLRDFQPVTLAVLQPNVLVANPSLPAKNVQELVALAHAKPGQLNYGSAGNATSQHLAGALFNQLAKVDIVHVPYKGVPQSLVDLLGGRVQLAYGSPVSILPHVREGKLRMMGVTTAQRQPSMPDVPTIAESGVPGYEFTGWLAMFVPKGTPRVAVERLQAETVRIVHTSEVKQLLNNGGTEPVGSTPEQFTATLKSEIARYTKVAKEAGIKAE